MSWLIRAALACVIGVVVYLVCLLLGPLLADLKVSFAVTLGGWLATYGGVLGLLAALWYFLSGSGIPWRRTPP